MQEKSHTANLLKILAFLINIHTVLTRRID
jgi:hypothetical protein